MTIAIVAVTSVTSVVATLLIVLLISNLTAGEKKITYMVESSYGVEDPQFPLTLGNLLGPALVGGNRIVRLNNGQEIFPAMLEAIRNAHESICFETFIYWEGDIGRKFADAIIERARSGVQVHVLLDWLGANKVDERYLNEMSDAGAEVERYHPIRWYNLDRINNRTHRKLLVIDGRIGFTGGVGIADNWSGNAQDPDHWRDLHFRVEGPVVAQMQGTFMDNWIKTRSKVLHGPKYFPELAESTKNAKPESERGSFDCFGQIFKSSPREGSESMRLMFLMSIACARRSIAIGNAYFVPDDLLVAAIVAARKRDVRVRVLVPGKHIDTALVRKASRARWGELLKAGVEIHEFSPTMYHAKILIVDDIWTSVGSTNFDNRSLRLNDEANLNILNREFAATLNQDFEKDLQRSHLVTLQEWQNRPLTEKLVGWLAVVFRSQL